MEAHQVKQHCWFNSLLILSMFFFTLSISLGSAICFVLSILVLGLSIFMLFRQIKLPKLPKMSFNPKKWLKRQEKLVEEEVKPEQTEQTEEDKLFEEVEEELDD